MQHLFWLVEGKIAGRSGPNKDPWDLAELKASGIRAVLSVNGGEGCEPGSFQHHGLRYECIPFSRNVPPQEGDIAICVAQLPRALAFIQQCEADDLPVLIHCRSGKRSATAIRELENAFGYTNLYNLKGGILAISEEQELLLSR